MRGQALIWNAADLMQKPEEFRTYYNEHRTHQSLNGSTPGERSGQPPPSPVWRDIASEGPANFRLT